MRKINTYQEKAWFILCLFFIFYLTDIKAQEHSIDSLYHLIKITKNDTLLSDHYANLAYEIAFSDTVAGRQYAIKALSLAKSVKDDKRIGNGYIALGSIASRKNDFKATINYYLKALKAYEKANHKKGIARTYNNLGIVYYLQKDYNTAIENYQKSLTIKEEIGDEFGLAPTYNNIGAIYAQMEKYELANIEFEKSLAIEKKAKNYKGIAESIQSMGNVAVLTKKWKTAETLFTEALAILDSVNDLTAKANCLESIGSMYANVGKPDDAILYVSKARSLMENWGTAYDIEIIYETFISSYKQKGDYKKALLYTDSLLNLRKSIYSTELLKETEEILAKYESEKKNQKIELLEQKEKLANAVAEKRKAWIFAIAGILIAVIVFIFFYFRHLKIKGNQKRVELEQKALRAQMNPHFIFNSLNAIQDMYVGGETNLANNYMGDFGELMRRILENSGENKITLKEETDTLKLYLELETLRSGGLLSYTIQIDENIDQFNTYVPALVIQPFVENAVWHGILVKKEKGKVDISLKKMNGKLLCVIEDDGIGYEKSMASKTADSHESKGMKLTEQRLGNKIKIETLNPGTRITLIIPS